ATAEDYCLSLHDALPISTTDLNGRYALEVTRGSTVVFSIVGYDAFEVENVQENVVNAVMAIATSQIEDVVVVAFGTQKKKELVRSEEHTSELQSRENLVC